MCRGMDAWGGRDTGRARADLGRPARTAAPGAAETACCLVRQQDRYGHGGEQGTRCAAHDPLTHAAVAVGAHYDEVAAHVVGGVQNDVAHADAFAVLDEVLGLGITAADAVVGDVFFTDVAVAEYVFVAVDLEHHQFLAVLEERRGIGEGACGFAPLVPAIQNALANGGNGADARNHEHGATGCHYDGFGQIRNDGGDRVDLFGLAHHKKVAIPGMKRKGFVGITTGRTPLGLDARRLGTLEKLLAHGIAVFVLTTTEDLADVLRDDAFIVVMIGGSVTGIHPDHFGVVLFGNAQPGIDTARAGFVVAQIDGDTTQHVNPPV